MSDKERKEEPLSRFEQMVDHNPPFFGKEGTLAAYFTAVRDAFKDFAYEWAWVKEDMAKQHLYEDACVSLILDGFDTDDDDVIVERIQTGICEPE